MKHSQTLGFKLSSGNLKPQAILWDRVFPSTPKAKPQHVEELTPQDVRRRMKTSHYQFIQVKQGFVFDALTVTRHCYGRIQTSRIADWAIDFLNGFLLLGPPFF